MSESVELSTLDLRYEGYRLRDDAREVRLLASIAQRGIEEPLEGVDTSEARPLLNGHGMGGIRTSTDQSRRDGCGHHLAVCCRDSGRVVRRIETV